MADPAKIEAVLRLIESGNSEQAACKEVGINRGTFRSAALKYGAAETYARATEALARDQAGKIEEVIEEMRAGTLTPEIGRIELDARKWIAQRMFRPLWGDKVAVTGPSGEGPILAELTVKFV